MTWHTSTGDRYLTGAEAELFRAALKETLEAFERETLDCTDTLLEVQTKDAKVHLFALVAKHLLEPTEEIAPLNAWTEGAVGVVFSCAANALDGELETERTTGEQPQYWRKRILVSALEKGWKSGDEAAEHSAASFAEDAQAPDWHEMLEFLEEQILWDNDWASDPFGPQAGDFNRGQESYFQWCHRSSLDTRAAIRLLGQLSGYRRGELEGR
ncbi:MAG: hypothetical protein ACTHK7_06915 [Aureliella sp.]